MATMIKFRAWYMPFGKYGAMQEMVYSRASHILALAETEPEKYIPEQFTGLKDVNGRDIYVGDILEVTIDGAVQADKYLVKNVWDPHVWTEESDGYYAVSKMKVQGNVHENPELLEADK
ncbi:hypothetical protein CEB41_02580 [Lactiplantibacillus plantarum]|nr:hypothetical protein CEB41_02580 [Lactiplantibacillus plantarum]